jgi:hypothetical protein
MPQRLNFKSDCPTCGVTYLYIPTGVTNSTVIHCSSCDTPLGMWYHLKTSFVAQVGVDGIPERDDGHITLKA